MRIAYITAGAAGMYCGSCLHDNTLAAAMQRQGHDVALIPTYTPVRTDEQDVSIGRVFFGAVNVYLQQKSGLFRHTPWVVDRILDRPGLLKWVSRFSSSTSARELGEMVVSMLQGEEGMQSKELEKLVEWLADSHRPEIVHLTNSMFLGLANRIKKRLGVPVLCSVQGEDIFFDELVEPHKSRVTKLLRAHAADVDGFVVNSSYYAGHMAGVLGVPKDRMHQVPLGVNLSGHGVAPRGLAETPFTVGYLARLCPEKGLHLLAEAFKQLTDSVGKDRVRLRVAGYLGKRDESYVEGIREQIRHWGLEGSFDFLGEVDRQGKIDLLNGVHVLTVPTCYKEPKGLFVLEALANGTPVVQPAHGAFPELIESTGGGVLFEPDSVPALAATLEELMSNPERRQELGRRGKEAVHRDFSDASMASRTLDLYRRFTGNETGSRR